MARSLNIDKMMTFPKLIYRFNAVSIRISTNFSIEIGKLILKFIWCCKGSRISKTIVENEQNRRTQLPNFKFNKAKRLQSIDTNVDIYTGLEVRFWKQNHVSTVK